MSRSCLLSIALVCLFVCHPLDARPGKGGGGPKRGGGPKISRGGGKSFAPKSVGGGNKIQSPSGKGKPNFTSKGNGNSSLNAQGRGNGQTAEKLTGRERAVNVQRGNEERKLTQRQATAQKLREISARNGNDNLKDVADRMDQKAMDHYNKRQAKIDQLEQRGTPFDQSEFNDPLDQPLTDQQIANLDDPILQQNHRFLNEQRKFEHQMQIAQQLREISARNGNPNLLNTAARMEQMAAHRFASQFTKIFGPETPIPDPLSTTPLLEPLTAPLPRLP